MNTNIYSMLDKRIFKSVVHYSRNRNRKTLYYEALWEWW